MLNDLSSENLFSNNFLFVTYTAYNPEHNDELTQFNDKRYKVQVRPALYENYNWLPEEIKLQIFKIDQGVFHA